MEEAAAKTKARGGPSQAQRLAALERANRIRSERAALKRALRAGCAGPAPLLLDPPECLLSATVAEVLLATPGVGEVKLRRILNGCRISPSRKLERLSARQREELARALPPRR